VLALPPITSSTPRLTRELSLQAKHLLAQKQSQPDDQPDDHKHHTDSYKNAKDVRGNGAGTLPARVEEGVGVEALGCLGNVGDAQVAG